MLAVAVGDLSFRACDDLCRTVNILSDGCVCTEERLPLVSTDEKMKPASRSLAIVYALTIAVASCPSGSAAQDVAVYADSTAADRSSALLRQLGLSGDAAEVVASIRARYDSPAAPGTKRSTSPWDIAVLVPPRSDLLERMPIVVPDVTCDCVFDPTADSTRASLRKLPPR